MQSAVIVFAIVILAIGIAIILYCVTAKFKKQEGTKPTPTEIGGHLPSETEREAEEQQEHQSAEKQSTIEADRQID